MFDVAKNADLSPFGLTDEAQDQLRKTMQEVAEAAAEAATEAAQAEAEPETEDVTEDEVEKAAVPEEVRKRMEAQEAELANLKKQARTREFMEKAAPLTILGGSTEERADLLMKIADGDTEAVAALEESLAAAQAQVDQSDLFKAVGADGQGDTTADSAIRKRADKIREDEPGLTPEQALVKAYRENPSAYDAEYGA